ncbi:unnamed protein product [Cunninghamella blakesleeana]
MTEQKDKEFAVPPPRPKKVTDDGFAVPPPRPKKTTNDEFAAPPPKPKKQTGTFTSTERESITEKDNIKEPTSIKDNSRTNNTDSNKDDQALPLPQLKYNKPDWAGVASYDYSLEVIKGGVSIDKIHGPRKDFITIGRLPLCDILMEHPSLSRYHAIIQFNQEGDAFLYDLDSGYGTRVNKKTIEPRTYVPLKTGDQIRFAESTRLCIFDTEKPQDSVDDENDDDELNSEEEVLLKHRTRAADVEHVAEDEDDQGISWGFQEDAVEEDDDEIDTNTKSDAHLLSIESEKMAMADAKRRRKDLETMYGDDDSDEELYDKTDVKKRKAMKKEQKAETHDDLIKRQLETEIKIKELKEKIEKKKIEDEESKKKVKEENDDLESYMDNLSKTSDNSSASMFTLQKELKNLEKVIS